MAFIIHCLMGVQAVITSYSINHDWIMVQAASMFFIPFFGMLITVFVIKAEDWKHRFILALFSACGLSIGSLVGSTVIK